MRTRLMLASLLLIATLAGCSSSSGPAPSSTAPSPAAARVQALLHGEGEARAVVALFGRRLQNVSLQSPIAARQMRTQYAGLVAPALLGRWLSDVSAAPGRQVSSPWPDRIAISALSFHGSRECMVSGHLVMMSSVELASGGSAAQVRVRLQLRRSDDRWLIAGYSQGL